MDARKIIIATSFFSAVLVLSVVVPLGYFSFQTLTQRLEAGQAQVQKVVIELKTEALQEIQTATQQINGEGAKTASQTDPAVIAILQELQTNVDALRTDQQQMFEQISAPVEAVGTVSAVVMPGSRDDTLNQTVLFPMGKIAGPKIDQQVATLTLEITEYGLNRDCQSNVMGFSDTLGGDKSNLKLSHDRATHVATLLRAEDIPVGDVKGWGERWLKVHTVDGIENEQNRRVVIETVCDGSMSMSDGAVS